MIGHHEAGDDRLAQAPTRFDQALVGAGDRMLGEHDAGGARVEQGLHHDADARPREQADLLAIGDGRIGIGRPPDLAHRVGHVGGRVDVEHRQMLAGEACRGAVFVDADDLTANGRRAMAFATSRSPFIAGGDRFDESPESATPGGTGRPSRAASPSPTAFEP
jgi:hypothetical protein